MANRFINITATGGWDQVACAQRSGRIVIQARTAVAVSVRYTDNPTETWTIKASTVWETHGVFWPTDIEVQAVAGTVIEVEVQALGSPMP